MQSSSEYRPADGFTVEWAWQSTCPIQHLLWGRPRQLLTLVWCVRSVSLFGSHLRVKPFMYLRSILFCVCFLSHVWGVCFFSFLWVRFVFFHVPFRFHFAPSLDVEKAVTQEVRSNPAWSISRARRNASRAFLVAQRESVLLRLRSGGCPEFSEGSAFTPSISPLGAPYQIKGPLAHCPLCTSLVTPRLKALSVLSKLAQIVSWFVWVLVGGESIRVMSVAAENISSHF